MLFKFGRIHQLGVLLSVFFDNFTYFFYRVPLSLFLIFSIALVNYIILDIFLFNTVF